MLNDLFKTLADESRVRLVLLLQQQELTVAELAEITQLAQPRVSTHLAHLKKQQLVVARKQGVSAYYRLNAEYFEQHCAELLQLLNQHYEQQPIIQQDNRQLAQVLANQAVSNQWVDTVAGDMERHYSPGRTWEATARVMAQLTRLGQVLDLGSGDGVLAELMAAQTDHYTCVDNNNKAIEAARNRLQNLNNVSFHQADIHHLPLPSNTYDCILMLHVLTYSEQPEQVIKEAFRVCQADGRLLISTLAAHHHETVLEEYGHKNLGFECQQIESWCKQAGFSSVTAHISSQEQRKPHFKIITAEAHK